LLPITGYKKKLYALNPANPPQFVQSQRTRRQQRRERADPKSLEQQVRQLLADKVSGNQIGIWLLVPEHLRLGTWDLLLRWTDQPTPQLEPRLALHVVNEAALCLCSYRHGRSLAQKGFEAANGLPFVPSDQAIHEMLDRHTVQQSQELQIALGKLRRAGKHFRGRLLAMDPHRMGSYSKRRMRLHRFSRLEKPGKMGQAFFLLDGDTGQPVCFTLLSSAQSVSEASPELLRLAAEILPRPAEGKPLVLTDKEHYTQELFADVQTGGIFDLLSAVCAYPNCVRRWRSIPQSSFTEHWPGYATAVQPYQFKEDPDRHYHELVQRNGLREQDWEYQGFLATSLRPEVPSLTKDFPARWHVEEFFKFDQDLGWNRAGTLNLNVRYGQLTLALVAQAALHQLRQRLGPTVSSWDSQHLARNLLGGLEGDLRVQGDTIKVTVYNAPNATLLQSHYEDLPHKLERQGVNPRIPWLYNFKLDFRFT
jgi:hypothetical protein